MFKAKLSKSTPASQSNNVKYTLTTDIHTPLPEQRYNAPIPVGFEPFNTVKDWLTREERTVIKNALGVKMVEYNGSWVLVL